MQCPPNWISRYLLYCTIAVLYVHFLFFWVILRRDMQRRRARCFLRARLRITYPPLEIMKGPTGGLLHELWRGKRRVSKELGCVTHTITNPLRLFSLYQRHVETTCEYQLTIITVTVHDDDDDDRHHDSWHAKAINMMNQALLIFTRIFFVRTITKRRVIVLIFFAPRLFPWKNFVTFPLRMAATSRRYSNVTHCCGAILARLADA